MAEYDPLLTMAALNLAVVSLHKITSTGDRVILDREYTGIINNLRMGEINADPELTSLYQEMMRVIRQGRLRDEVRAGIESEYSQQKQKSIKEIVSGSLGKTFSSNPVKWLGKLAATCVSEYFRSKVKAEFQHDGEQFRLRKEELTEYDALQRKLLDSSWKLLRQYKLPDSYRLTQSGLDNFYAAMLEDSPSKRMRMLKYLAGDFAMYSPYWFYRGRTAHEAGDFKEAGECFRKFGEVWRPVLRKDSYKAEALKYMVEELVQEGISAENAGEILRCLEEFRENVPLGDWANNIYMGMMYFTLGRNEKAIECVMCNIDFGFETETSGEILAKFDGGTPPKRIAPTPAKSPEAPKPEPVREVREEPEVPPSPKPEPKPKKQSLRKRAERGDVEAQYQLGVYYEKIAGFSEESATSLIICIIVALASGYAGWVYLKSASFWWNILVVLGAAFIGHVVCAFSLMFVIDNLLPHFKEYAKYWLTKAAENGHVEAMYRLAEIYRKEDRRHPEAERWYKNAAVRGHIFSQLALSVMYRLRYRDDSHAYIWAYLAYLCGGTENLGNKPELNNYPISLSDARKAEAEAHKMFNDIHKHKGGTNS